MHVVLVIAVGARTKDRGEARAGALAQAETKILADLRIGQPHDGAVGKLHRSDVDGICLAVLGELCADDPIAAAAIIGGVVVEAPERRAEADAPRGPDPPVPIARWPRQTCSERSRAASAPPAFCHAGTPLRAARRPQYRTRRVATTGGADCTTANSAVSRSRQADGGGGSSGSDASAACAAGGAAPGAWAGRDRGNGTACAATTSASAKAQRAARIMREGRTFTVGISGRIAT